MVGILDNLNFSQQSEMVYIGYFNRAADAGGFDFWSGENVRAQTSLKQSAPDAIKNIANSFTPQAETLAIYPFLSTTSFDPKNPATVASIGSLVDGIYANLFGRVAAAGDAGRQFWIDKILSGSVGIGESVLLIANGATGQDSNILLNKINVALDFTTRTKAANLGINTLTPEVKAGAKSALSVIEGVALQDSTVTAGQSITTVVIDRNTGPTTTLGSVPSTTDATNLPANTNFALSGLASVKINNLSSSQTINNFTGTVAGKVSVSMAAGNSTLNLDLNGNNTTGAGANFTFRDTTNNGVTNGIEVNGVTAINLISNGTVKNTVAGFYKASGSTVSGITVTITGTAPLVLGSPSALFVAFGSANGNTGVTIKAAAFTGGLTYAGSGSGDTVIGGSGGDTIFAAARDTITTGAGADQVILLSQFSSSTASDIAFITDFTPGIDKIVTNNQNNPLSPARPAHNWFDDTAANLDGKANLALAAQQAFRDYVNNGNTETFNDVVMFKWQGKTYDAISRDGSFAATGYTDGQQSVKESIVGINQVTQFKTDFLL